MLETLENLYKALQLEKRPWIRASSARWYLLPRGSREWDGPYEASEIAYLIYVGRISRNDTVVSGESWSQYVVGRHQFLAQWAEHSRDKEGRLLRGLLKSFRLAARNRGGEKATPSLHRGALTTDQARAFAVLDLSPTSTLEERRRRHRDLAKAHHPDHGGSVEKMKEINWAFEVVARTATL